MSECPDHWHCNPQRAAHDCSTGRPRGAPAGIPRQPIDRTGSCPTCGALPAEDVYEQIGAHDAAEEHHARRRLEAILGGAWLDGYLDLTPRAVDADPPDGLVDTAWAALREHTTLDQRMEADARAALEAAWWAGYLRKEPTPRFLDPFTAAEIPGLDRVADDVLAELLADDDPAEVLRRAGLNRGRP